MQDTTGWIDGQLKIPELLRSGVMEVLGLTLWAIHLWRIMSGRFALEILEESPAPAAERAITAGDYVGAVIDRYPVLLNTFMAFGFHLVSNPLLRRIMARHVTLAEACRHMGVDRETFLAALNDARIRHASSPAAAPHCCDSCTRRENHV
jgi:hypothetical protein